MSDVHRGSSGEEPDFSINYDIKYRMGEELEGESDQQMGQLADERMINPPQKRSEHRTFRGEKEITRFEMMRVFDGDGSWVRTLEESIFCTCSAPKKRLIAYKVFVNDLNDLVMRGLCNGCNTIAARYVETGEDPEKVKRIKAVLRLRPKHQG